jgi:hypothetical protein
VELAAGIEDPRRQIYPALLAGDGLVALLAAPLVLAVAATGAGGVATGV